ncbi:MAG: hypothetical protein HC772_09570 [Leptolyngbyaceae cyanobacterium CRU_2_3]|nr:hypothetical protein [Leptolyngbyaceae cyanobacterium CRU_2_3]
MAQRDRLAQDRIKAEKYQRLKAELQTKTQWESVLLWRAQAQQVQQVQIQIEAGDRTRSELNIQLTDLNQVIQGAIADLDRLNAKVKALGEDEQLSLQATLATREAELRQIQRQQQDLSTASREIATAIDRTQREIQEQVQQLGHVAEHQALETQNLTALQIARDQAKQDLEQQREAASSIATASEAWVQEQTALRHQIEAFFANFGATTRQQSSFTRAR